MMKFKRSNIVTKRTLKEKISDVSYDVKVWWNDNKEWAIIVLPVAAGLTAWMVRTIVTGSISTTKKLIGLKQLKKEQMLKELYCYDRSLGHYWKLNRELTNSEWLMVDARKKNGESLANILSSMRVI